MIGILFLATLTCSDVKDIAKNVRSNDFLSESVREEIVAELFAVAPEGCRDLETELSR